MATLAITRPSRAGTAFGTVSAAVGGDVFPNSGRELLYVRNANASGHTLTIATPGAPAGLELNDITVTVPAFSVYWIGPFHPDSFNDSNGRVSVTYSGVTSLNVAVLGR